MRIHFVFAAAFAACSLLACGTFEGPTEADDAALDGAADKADSASSTSTFYKARRDLRRCVSPVCGGYFVKRVNFDTTKCVDGTWKSECYVPSMDLSAIGVGSAVDAARDAAGTVFRGSIRPFTYSNYGNLGVFKATEAWTPANTRASASKIYRLSDSGIRCVRAPCPVVHSAKLNSTTAANVTGINFTAVGATSAQIDASNAALTSGGFLSAGVSRAMSGATVFAAEQIYARVRGDADPAACSVDSDCVYTAYTHSIASRSECYCARCAVQPMSRKSAEDNEAAWSRACSSATLICPAILCVMPKPVACVQNRCVVNPVP